jgi:hypothetical protein
MEVTVIALVHQIGNLEFPSNASAKRPPNFGWRSVDKLWNEFQMLAVQQVLANQGEF